MTSFPNRVFFILGPNGASPSLTRGGSRMPESGSYGSVRGALSNERPYRHSFGATVLSEILARLQIQAIYRESTGNRAFRFFAWRRPEWGPRGGVRRTNPRLGFQPSPILRAKASEKTKRSRYPCRALRLAHR